MTKMRVLTCGLTVLLVLAGVSPTRAGEIIFSIRDGRVTLVAHDAQLSDILAVWEREGRVPIVARERVQGRVAALELTNEPETAALETVLRSVSGFIAAKLAVAPRDGSIYRCIIVNPAPAPLPAPAIAAQIGPAAARRPQLPQQQPQMGLPPSMMGDPGMFPPANVPSQQDDNDDSGTGRGQPPQGMRQPGMPPVTTQRSPFDTPTGYDPPATSNEPARNPVYPATGMVVPGGIPPTPKPPGTPTQPGQKPPGSPIGMN